jgi:hypothetical protein
MSIGSTAIEDIEIPKKSRDEFPPFLRAMQYIYTNTDLNERIFSLLEKKICPKHKTGRPGMDLWTIFVLASARLCLNTDYDRLHYLANNDNLLRQMLGVQDGIVRGRDFDRQTIIDNVQLLDEETLREINTIVGELVHKIKKKKETEALRIKIDSFVTEANVHFPTDYNLLWDSARKGLDMLKQLILTDLTYINGWRKIDFWRKSLKTAMLKLSRASADKSKNRAERLKTSAENYLTVARKLHVKLQNVKPLENFTIRQLDLLIKLEYFLQMLAKHIDLVDRRLLKSEQIPHEEKLFSIFEPWVEWVCKGKAHKPVEFGKPTCISTDQWQFIVGWQISNHQQDNQLLIPCVDKVIEKYKLSVVSGDKGFFSKIDFDLLSLFGIQVVIPKKGKLSLSDKERQSDTKFIKLRHKHSAIESNINELEHRGLNRCHDKGFKGFCRYVGLAVISYNLCRIGKLLLEADRKALSVYKRAA